MLVNGGDTANLPSYMVQNSIGFDGANAKPFCNVGGKTPSKVVEAPLMNATDGI